MPVGYTAMYAQRLDEISSLDVHEAREGEVVQAGRMYLAPAGLHLSFTRKTEGDVRVQVGLRPAGTQHRPAVDVLFRSAADVYGSRVLGVVMTGMGNDGLAGSAYIQAKGGRILTEAESSVRCLRHAGARSPKQASANTGWQRWTTWRRRFRG